MIALMDCQYEPTKRMSASHERYARSHVQRILWENTDQFHNRQEMTARNLNNDIYIWSTITAYKFLVASETNKKQKPYEIVHFFSKF